MRNAAPLPLLPLLPLMALLLALCCACEPRQPDDAGWRDDGYHAVTDVGSAVATAYLAVRELQHDRLPGSFAQVTVVTAEEDAGKAADTFGAEQPPVRDDRQHERAMQALSSAEDLLSAVRIAVVRRNEAAYPGLLARLTQTRGALDRLGADLGGVRGR